MPLQTVTISKIAAEAGVSKSTVSRVLNDHPSVLPETKLRIKAVIDKYNFQPNMYARNISQQRSYCLGLVILHDIDYTFRNQFYTEIQRFILKTAKQHGYHVLLICSADLKEAVSMVMEKRVDGLVVVSPRLEQSELLAGLAKEGIPLVCIGQLRKETPCYQVCTNNYDGALLAMRHLFDLGHRRIGYINGPHFLPSSTERARAYWDAMNGRKFPITAGLVQEGTNSIDSGYTATCVILNENPDVTAFFVASDYMAIGVENAIRDRGLRVPEDVSVVSFDNIPMAEQISPALSTIDQHIGEKAVSGVETLLALIEGKPIDHDYHVEIAPTLVVRESTTTARKN